MTTPLQSAVEASPPLGVRCPATLGLENTSTQIPIGHTTAKVIDKPNRVRVTSERQEVTDGHAFHARCPFVRLHLLLGKAQIRTVQHLAEQRRKAVARLPLNSAGIRFPIFMVLVFIQGT